MHESSSCGAILVVIDGCRPDGIQRAETPNIDTLIARGAYTFRAQSVVPSATLACHTSMFRGVTPSRHGITTDTWAPMVRPVPSIAEAAHAMQRRRPLSTTGRRCAIWQRRARSEGDLTMARIAAQHVAADQPDFCFCYLGVVDIVGHRHGWMSAEYIEQIGVADRAIGILLAQLEKANLLDRYGKTYGTDLPEDVTIPWIAAGAKVRQAGEIRGPVRIFDTAPTLAHVLDVPLSSDWEGQPIMQIFQEVAEEPAAARRGRAP